jgi:hypothetical protein
MHIRIFQLNIMIFILRFSIAVPIPDVAIFCPEFAMVDTLHYFSITTQLIVFTMIYLSQGNNANNVKIQLCK